MAYDTFPKQGARGKPSGYRGFKMGNQLVSKDTEFYQAQGVFARSEDAERVDQYAKPGTSAKKRQDDPFDTSFPTSRYRSRRP